MPMRQIVGSYSWVFYCIGWFACHEFPCSSICITHKINVRLGDFDMKYDISRFPHFFISTIKDISRTFQGQN